MGCSNSKNNLVNEDKTITTTPVSYKKLMDKFNNNTFFVNMIVEEGIKEFRTGIDKMVEILNKNEDLKELKFHAHSIKGSASNITCYNMSNLANKIENIIHESNDLTKDSIRVKNILDGMNLEIYKIQNIFERNKNHYENNIVI